MADEEGSKGSDGERKFHPKQAVAPIALMVVFIIVTISISLMLSAQFDALGYSSAFGEQADNPLWAFAFLAMMIVVAVVLLVLRKFLKRKKRNLKYLLAFAVFLATIGVVTPLLDMVLNGAPPTWESREISMPEDSRAVFPLDPIGVGDDIIIWTETDVITYDRELYDYHIMDRTGDLGTVLTLIYNHGSWIASGTRNGSLAVWTRDDGGTFEDAGEIQNPDRSMVPIGADIAPLGNEMYIVSYWENETDMSLGVSGLGEPGHFVEMRSLLPNGTGQLYPSAGWSLGTNLMFSGTGTFDYMLVEGVNGSISMDTSFDPLEGINWVKRFGEQILVENTVDSISSIQIIDRGETIPVRNRTGSHVDNVWLSFEDPLKWELIINGKDSFAWIRDGDEETFWLDSNAVGIYQEGVDGDVHVIDDEQASSGRLPSSVRNQWYVSALGMVISTAFILLLLKKPKWWLVDIGGLVMGAGVIAIMGISFPILFTLLLLVLLAGYDAVAVYKTKHMISLADSVVEAKMPILLVFPMKWSYRYEDEKNLMDPKRKRESLFMGLGDVIIPGLFIVSAYSFLSPVGGVRLFGLIYPPLGVALFTLLGMLLGYGILMRWVLKGKAHAGLPPLNGGSILGFLIGYLVIYGTVVFW